MVVAENVVAPVTPRVPDRVAEPAVSVPIVALFEKRLVEEAVVAKELVVVALVVVELTAVKFWRVEEARERKPPVKVEAVVEVAVKYPALT